MPRFSTIVFATDLSERARAVFPVVQCLGREGRVVVLHAVEQALFGASSGPGLPTFWPSDSPAHRGELEEEMKQQYPADGVARVEYQVCDGDPAGKVLRLADDVHADLIALGTHARQGVDRLLSGSVAETLLHKAPCAVLVHHLPEELLVDAGETRLVVHPTDFSSASETAFVAACALASPADCRLVLFHAAHPESGDAARQLDALKQRAEGVGLGGRVLTQVVDTGDAVHAIVHAGAEPESTIVMGTHGRTGVRRLLLGSTAEAVLRAARRPVVVVRPAAGAPGR